MFVCCGMTPVLDATIDFSPNPCAQDLTMSLTDENLQSATQSQIERFLRVWVTDRHEYAPKLKNLTIHLLAEEKENSDIVGIYKFLQYYVASPKNTTNIYISYNDGSLHKFRGLVPIEDLQSYD